VRRGARRAWLAAGLIAASWVVLIAVAPECNLLAYCARFWFAFYDLQIMLLGAPVVVVAVLVALALTILRR